MSGAPIGLFDSGVGGLSIWRQVVHALPSEPLLYVADQAHVPYGHRSSAEIQANSLAIAGIWLPKAARQLWWPATPRPLSRWNRSVSASRCPIGWSQR